MAMMTFEVQIIGLSRGGGIYMDQSADPMSTVVEFRGVGNTPSGKAIWHGSNCPYLYDGFYTLTIENEPHAKCYLSHYSTTRKSFVTDMEW